MDKGRRASGAKAPRSHTSDEDGEQAGLSGAKAQLWTGELASADLLAEPPVPTRPPHFRAPSARATMKPTTSRNMATDSSTVMTTMPPVRAIPSPMEAPLRPVGGSREV